MISKNLRAPKFYFMICIILISINRHNAWPLHDYIDSIETLDPNILSTKYLMALEEFKIKKMQLDLDEKRFYIYRNKKESHIRNSTFQQQLTFNVIILTVVIVIIVTGLMFSYIHMKKTSTDPTQETSIEITRDGLKIRSSVIGLLILIVSLVFFYLYLTEVYTIEELSTE